MVVERGLRERALPAKGLFWRGNLAAERGTEQLT